MANITFKIPLLQAGPRWHSDEIVGEGLGDFGLHKVAGSGLAFQKDTTIDLRGLGSNSSSQGGSLTVCSLDQDLRFSSHQPSIFFKRNFLLNLHQDSEPFFFHLFGDWIGQPESRRPLFRGVMKGSEVIELNLFNT